MSSTILIFVTVLSLLSYGVYGAGRRTALRMASGRDKRLRNRADYYGYYAVLWVAFPTLFAATAWLLLEPAFIKRAVIEKISANAVTKDAGTMLYMQVENYARGVMNGEPNAVIEQGLKKYVELKETSRRTFWALISAVLLLGACIARKRITPELRAQQAVERAITALLLLSSTVAILTTAGIIFSLVFETIRFFQVVPPGDFLFGTKWSPQIAIRADQSASAGAFGAVPLFLGTAMIAAIAMLVAAPVGLLSAIYLSEYAHVRVRTVAKPMLEVLAGIPTVVYGFFAALSVAPFFARFGSELGITVSPESALAAGIVMGIMIIPFVSSLSDDVLRAVPQNLRDASYAIGATQSETIKQVVVPAALPGIVGALLLAVSRAIGETMIVVMAAGLAANLTINPLENLTTVTVQIVVALTGDQEFDSPKTLSAFALGMTLFCVTLVLNVIALKFVKHFREKYE